ncbi:MAG TPA: glycosyltransferase [Thermoplasmata archaeon]|nr:glycosyltransferase [Thermoplasmata archaeon]
MVDVWLLALVVAGSIIALLFQGAAIVLALAMPALEPPVTDRSGNRSRVSAIVAARNEETDLPACLDDLIAQSYPDLEILVVDGGSTDRTRDVARARAPRVRLIEEPPLPPGWVGKNWACDVGYRAATGHWLLFTDADMRYHPDTVRATVDWAERENADLATLAPRIVTSGFWEKVVMPFYAQMVLTYFRTPRVNRADSRAAMANGQFLMVRREAYERIGGHRAIRTSVLEDVRLAEEFRAAGRTLRVAWAPELISTEMYRTRAEMFEGLLKNVHGARFSAVRQVGFLVGLIAFFWLPLLVLPLGLLWGLPALAVWGAFLYGALFGKHVALARGLRTRGWYGLAFPLAVGYYLVLVATSLGRGLRHRPLAWKGRSYPIER